MKILIVNVNWIGDVLFSTFLIRCLKKSHPQSYIATLSSGLTAQLLENNPYLDEIIDFDPFKERGYLGVDISLAKKIKRFGFTHSLHLHRSFSRRLLVYFAGIEHRIGYPEKYSSILLTDFVASQRDKIHRAEYYFNLSEPVKVQDDGEGLDLFLQDSEVGRTKAKFISSDTDRFVVMHVGANWQAKKWPLEYFFETAKILYEKYEIKTILTGSKQDENLSFKNITGPVNYIKYLVGKTGLKELASLISLSRLCIASDTAPLHIAVALKIPVIAVFGPTSEAVTGPFRPAAKTIVLKEDVGCTIPCYKPVCPFDYKCINSIKPQHVLEAAGDILSCKG
ncbi:MAG: lipopolysaccharide heptosyltransferase II [Candidatus Omnitrophica bacterium]|nr:lipopolysaccharide heptosyltransferase II [Candidatus Omnitrophota bacterium]